MSMQVSHLNRLNGLAFCVSICLIAGACRNIIQYEGKTKIISRNVDITLADSVLIFGKIVSAYDTLWVHSMANVWTDEQPKDAFTNNLGLYQLKLPSGTYTIHGSHSSRQDPFTQTTQKMKLEPNEKIELNFYLGGRIE